MFTFGMTVTSVDLAMDNYTQVEKIGAKSAVHVLAILKPSRTDIIRGGNDSAVKPYYKEIIYPLDAGVPPNTEYYQSSNMPRAKIHSHARQADPIGNHLVPILKDSGKSSGTETQASESAPSNKGPLEANGAPRPAEPMVQTSNLQSASTKERLSERDLQATRTFAILPMLEVGENPWDLGSRLLNLKTVMGTDIVDWFLPIRRSPCCNHEDAESQYAMGPGVDLLRYSAGFTSHRDTDAPRRRRKRKQTHPKRADEISTGADVPTSDPNILRSQPNSSIPLQDLNDASPPPHPT